MVNISSVLEVNGIMSHDERGNYKSDCHMTPFEIYATFQVIATMRPFFSGGHFVTLCYIVTPLHDKVLVL